MKKHTEIEIKLLIWKNEIKFVPQMKHTSTYNKEEIYYKY